MIPRSPARPPLWRPLALALLLLPLAGCATQGPSRTEPPAGTPLTSDCRFTDKAGHAVSCEGAGPQVEPEGYPSWPWVCTDTEALGPARREWPAGNLTTWRNVLTNQSGVSYALPTYAPLDGPLFAGFAFTDGDGANAVSLSGAPNRGFIVSDRPFAPEVRITYEMWLWDARGTGKLDGPLGQQGHWYLRPDASPDDPGLEAIHEVVAGGVPYYFLSQRYDGLARSWTTLWTDHWEGAGYTLDVTTNLLADGAAVAKTQVPAGVPGSGQALDCPAW